jgi:hypothetical protein
MRPDSISASPVVPPGRLAIGLGLEGALVFRATYELEHLLELELAPRSAERPPHQLALCQRARTAWLEWAVLALRVV